MTYVDPGDDDHDDDETISDELREGLNVLLEKRSPLEDAARRIGLYLNDVQLGGSSTGQPVMVADFNIGDVAFAKRVQFPDDASIDKEFEAMAASTEQDRFLDTRNEIQDRIARGLDPFGEDDEP